MSQLPSSSVPSFEMALSLIRQHREAEALHLLEALAEKGDRRAAALAGQLAQKPTPQLQESQTPEAWYHKASAQLASGQIEAALKSCQQALQRQPAFPQALELMGILWFQVKNLRAALQCFQRYLALKPGSARAHNNCGLVLSHMGRTAEAEAYFRRALKGQDAFDGAALNLAILLYHSDRIPEALTYFQQACDMAPRNAENFAGLAEALQALGRVEEAYKAFLHAIELAPSEPSLYRRMLTMGKDWPLPPPQEAALRALEAEENTMAEKARSELHFALYQVCEAQHQDQDALRHLLAANAARRKIVDFSEQRVREMAAEIRAQTPAALFADPGKSGDSSELPIFILGMPRSGTTLLEQALVSYPGVYSIGETSDFGMVIGCRGRNAPEMDFAALSGDDLQRLGRRYLKRIRPRAPEAERIINKLPENFWLAGYIHLLLPRARIIHMQRDAMDTCASCFAQDFQGNLDFSFAQTELGHFYRIYQETMAHWRAVLPAGTLCEVSYEKLVTEFEAEMRRVLDFCGLGWDPACLEFYKGRRTVMTSSLMQVRQPLYRSSIGRWKRYQAGLGPLQKALSGEAMAGEKLPGAA